jgi:hypothetical protein
MERSLRISEHLKNSQLGIGNLNATHNLALLEKFSLEGGGRYGFEPPGRFEPLVEIDDEWHEPELLHGDRVIPIGGRASERGEVPIPGENALLPDESGIERRGLITLMATAGVMSIRTQTPTAPYFDDDGVERYHTFDISFRTKNGRKVATAIKPERRREEVVDIIKRIKVHPDFDMLADDAVVLTDLDIDEGPYSDAWSIFMERLCFDPVEYMRALRDVSRINGEVRFAALLKGALSEAARRTAIWNLIYSGCLVPVHREPITDRSMLRKITPVVQAELLEPRRATP